MTSHFTRRASLAVLGLAAVSTVLVFGQDNPPKAQPATEPANRGGEVLGTLNSTYNTTIGLEGRKVDVPAFKVSTGSTEVICYIPPFGFDLESVKVAIPTDDGLWTDMTAHEVARRIKDRLLDPATSVVVTLRVEFADSMEFRRAVLEDSLAQGYVALDEKLIASIRAGDPKVINAKCVPLPVRSFTLTISHGGSRIATLPSDANPVLSSSIEPQLTLPAGIVERMLSPTGVSVGLRMHPLLQKSSRAKGFRQQRAKDFVERAMKEVGEGGLEMTSAMKGTAQKSKDNDEVAIICRRDALVDAVRKTAFTDDLTIEGDDLSLIESVANIIQAGEVDLFAVAESEQEAILREAIAWDKLQETPGFLATLDRVAGNENYAHDDFEMLTSTIDQSANSSMGGGGLSLGPVALGAGGGSSSAKSNASKFQIHKQAERLSAWLKEGRTAGQFPVPPELDLKKVTRNRLDKAFSQSVLIVLGGPAYADAVSQEINTAQSRLTPRSVEQLLRAQRRLDELRK